MQAVWLAVFLAVSVTSAWAGPWCLEFNSLRESAVEFRRLGTTSARVHVEGTLPVVKGNETVDPASTGIRLVFTEFVDGLPEPLELLDLMVPSGPSWTTPRPGRWVYRARVSTGVRRVVVQQIEPLPLYGAPRAYTVAVDAVGLELPAVSDLRDHLITVFLHDTASMPPQPQEPFVPKACGSQHFGPSLIFYPPGDPPYAPPVWDPRCTLGSEGRTMACTSGPRVRPCRVSHPVDLMRCDALQAGVAQAAFHAAHGTYFNGDCSDLPGVTPSANVVCETHGDADDFYAITRHPGGFPYDCIIDSDLTLSCSP